MTSTSIGPQDLFLLLVIVVSIALVGFFFFRKLKRPLDDEHKAQPPIPFEEPTPELQAPKEVLVPWKDRLRKGLNLSHSQLWHKLEKFVGKDSGSLTDEERDELESLLYKTDMGPKVVSELLHYIEREKKQTGVEEGKNLLFQFLDQKLSPYQQSQNSLPQLTTPRVLMIVGVNGVGKTTTIGKLATKFQQQGLKVVVGACDTFRAAAVDQLAVWCERANVTMVRAKEGSDPSAAIFETCQKAKEMNADYCIIDTAGRLQNNDHLMEELKKGKRVAQKVIDGAPHDIYLVLDAITGQHALKQAKEFHQHLQLTGLIYTKCDGSSKAGSAVGIMDELKIPIKYIGVGEHVEDLNDFSLKDYLEALLGIHA